ncbi:hypothetical protein HHI36_020734 [Cryptolaemus montrouzieri]|uniref:Uncharacterized protein n=1 Tax=Cryptolaemus montrouzieri TaxID=559131 RepID=A0ABD2NB87_9CUCU
MSENNLQNTKPLSKSSDWIEASLEVPEKDSPVHLRNPKLAFIFNNEDSGTPTPPPRKHKKGIREKIEAVAKSGLQAFQSKKPVEEPLCVKKTVNYDCPCDRLNHKHNHHDHVVEKNILNKEQQKLQSKKSEHVKETKRKKNLSVVSLPNYSELKFSIANFADIDRAPNDGKSIKSSNVSLPGEAKKSSKNYMIRCRSFGSLLPQQLLDKLKPSSNKITDIESDDSFGPLEDWDLGLIEHYNPRDASLPRPRKLVAKPETKVISDIESLILTEDVVPTPPARKSEMLSSNVDKVWYEPQNFSNDVSKMSSVSSPASFTEFTNSCDDNIEHSSLMRILEEFSIKDKQQSNNTDLQEPLLNKDSKGDKEDNLSDIRQVKDFIKAEKTKTSQELENSGVSSAGSLVKS